MTALVIMLLTSGRVVLAQRSNVETRWAVTVAGHVDLWFSAIAQLELPDSGPLPLYSAEHRAEVARVKQDRGMSATPLTKAQERLQRILASDPNYEHLHFIPLYFPTTDVEHMLGAVQALNNSRLEEDLQGDQLLGFAVLEHVLTGRQQREVARLARLIDQEWTLYYEDYFRVGLPARMEYVAQVSRRLRVILGRGLADLLSRYDLNQGLVVVTPALGAEGRNVNFERRLGYPIIAVPSVPDTSGPMLSTAIALHELCYLMMQDEEAERRTTRPLDALHCGDALIGRFDAEAQPAYREFLLRSAGSAADASENAFYSAFPISAQALERIRDQFGK